MTRYEDMIRRAEILHRAFVNAQNREIKELWYRQYKQLVVKAKSLTIEQAEEIRR